jgi:methyl-accepting chemotaxis protein
MSMQRRSSESSGIFDDVPGARDYAWSLVAVMAVFAALIGASTYYVVKTIQIGAYGALQIDRRFIVIVVVWLALSLALALGAAWVSTRLSRRITGPVRRMERLLDRMIAQGDVTITLREKDALYPIAEKVNRIVSQQRKKEQE